VDLSLIRVTKDGNLPTYGVLVRADGVPFALSLERPWLNNQKGVSCIPAGSYKAVRHISPKFGETFWLRDVEGRAEILFHKGNIDDDSHGCILVGEQFNYVKNEDGITASAEGFAEFMRIQKDVSEFTIEIKDPG